MPDESAAVQAWDPSALSTNRFVPLASVPMATGRDPAVPGRSAGAPVALVAPVSCARQRQIETCAGASAVVNELVSRSAAPAARCTGEGPVGSGWSSALKELRV